MILGISFLISSCKLLPPLEICKYRPDTRLCVCQTRNMFSGENYDQRDMPREHCFKGVIISVNSWGDLDSYLRKAGKNKKVKRLNKKYYQ